jgi:hypothetical protein
MKSAWGSDDPTKAAFPFSHALALAEAGHEVQIYLLGEAVVLMRKVVADAVTPVGWPTVGDFLNKLSRETCADLRLRRLLASASRDRNRLSELRSEVRQPARIRVTGRMGRSHHHGIIGVLRADS